MPRANAVSRLLSSVGHQKATSSTTRIKGFHVYRAGFRCTNREDGSVRVEYDLGESLRYATQGRRDEVRRDNLQKFAADLKDRYEVTESLNAFNHPILTVRDRKAPEANR